MVSLFNELLCGSGLTLELGDTVKMGPDISKTLYNYKKHQNYFFKSKNRIMHTYFLLVFVLSDTFGLLGL